MTADQTDWTPMQVLEYTLHVTGEGLLTGDFDAFASTFDLPHHITTFEGSTVLNTRADLKATFDSVRKHFELHNISKIVRECISADFDVDHQIRSAHTTRLLCRDQQVGETSMAYSVLHLRDKRWVGTSSQYAVTEETLSQAIVGTSLATSHPSAPKRATPTENSKGRKPQ